MSTAPEHSGPCSSALEAPGLSFRSRTAEKKGSAVRGLRSEFDTFSVISWCDESELPVSPPALLIVLILHHSRNRNDVNSAEILILRPFSSFYEIRPCGCCSGLLCCILIRVVHKMLGLTVFLFCW